MTNAELTKVCRKSVQGYSEIVDNGYTADLDDDTYNLFYKRRGCRLECKWIISLLGVAVIVAGLCWWAKEGWPEKATRTIESDTTETNNGRDFITSTYVTEKNLHDRKKRNISNDTAEAVSSDYNITISRILANLSQSFKNVSIEKENLLSSYRSFERQYENFDNLWNANRLVINRWIEMYSNSVELTKRNSRAAFDITVRPYINSTLPFPSDLQTSEPRSFTTIPDFETDTIKNSHETSIGDVLKDQMASSSSSLAEPTIGDTTEETNSFTDSITKKSNIMKITPRSADHDTETVTPFYDSDTEPITELDATTTQPETNTAQIYQQILPELKKFGGKLVRGTEVISQNVTDNTIQFVLKKTIFKRSLNETDETDLPWKMICYKKLDDDNGQTKCVAVEIPISKSSLKYVSFIRRRRDLPAMGAHSLHTHKNFNECLNQTGDHLEMYCRLEATSQRANKTQIESEIQSFQRDTLTDIEQEICSGNQRICAEATTCIPQKAWCDTVINCPDRSDELNCSCAERIHEDKLCDGYFDCPDGEDEIGCFGCSKNEFSCDDWMTLKPNATCITRDKRCDNVLDCANGRDEEECELLADKIFSHDMFLVSYTSGYLHRNWKGKWYPVCADANSELSAQACRAELGFKTKNFRVELQPIPETYTGKFMIARMGNLLLVDDCETPVKTAVYVHCPDEYCGTRKGYDKVQLRYRYKRDLEEKQTRFRRDLKQHNETEIILQEIVRRVFDEFYNTSSSRRHENERNADTTDRRLARDVRVVGGSISGPGFWPWIVALYKNGIFHCGGVILDDTWIMTAAHCVEEYRDNYYDIQAGTLRRLSFSPMEQTRVVSHVIIHEDFVRSDMRNDIALLRLETPLKLNRWIRPICLPEVRPPWGPIPGEYCTAVGWGATKEHGRDPDNMREVEIPIQATCKHVADREGNEICAGYPLGGRDTCQGDSGGPLLCKIRGQRDRWYVAGIVSHGEGCARPMEFGVYTRISLYLQWLVKYTENHHLSVSKQTVRHCPGMKCKDGGRCIAPKKMCDKVIDCLNGEDEFDCNNFNARNQQEYFNDANITKMGVNSLDNMKKIFETGTTGKSSSDSNSELSRIMDNRDIYGDYDDVEKFRCKIIYQTIPKIWHCDGEVDCEDGTDELNCTCAEWLRSVNRSYICNGIVDCYDFTDEKYCSVCNAEQFYCYRSKKCINTTKQCDGKVDCLHGEDEQNCYALSDSINVTVDFFDTPIHADKGIVMTNKNGSWSILCVKADVFDGKYWQDEMHSICRYLGFLKAKSFVKIIIYRTSCNDYGIELQCEMYNDWSTLPWHANIYINGAKRCSGLLLTNQWIVADGRCRNYYTPQHDYITAALGGSKHLEHLIRSPNEQIIGIDYVAFYDRMNVTMIRLKNTPNYSKHVRNLRPTGHSLWTAAPSQNTSCLLIAGLDKLTVIHLVADKNCNYKNCHFRPLNKKQLCSHRDTPLSSIVCHSTTNGWYLAASTDIAEYCSSNGTLLHSNMWEDPEIISTSPKPIPSPKCADHRCQLGRCLSEDEICDGRTHCRNNEDETPEQCVYKKTACMLHPYRCNCKIHEFKCNNNRCIDKDQLCDGRDDCNDKSDEPSYCENFTCATYINLTTPSKLCDGRVDCGDKSDENLTVCPSSCKTSYFHCKNSSQCIPLEFVCDGEGDCLYKEDEEDCWKLDNNITDKNEANLLHRSRGRWQKNCLTSDLTDFSPLAICTKFYYKKVTAIHTIPGTKPPVVEYADVRLGTKEFKLRTKPFRPRKDIDVCKHVHVNCQ